MIRILAVLLTVSIAFGAEARLRHVYDIVFPAQLHPERYAEKTTGHFGRKFIAAPQKRFHGIPETPKRIRERPEPGVIRADLSIDKYGDVKDVAVLAATPGDIVDDSVIKFLKQRIGFKAEKDGKSSIEYETEVVLVFKPATRETSEH